MLLKESAIFMSIGLPITIAYLLTIISILERRNSNKPRKPFFPLRDACIAAIALDVYQLLTIFESQNGIFGIDKGTSALIVTSIMLAFHIGIISFSKRFPINGDIDEDKRALKLSVFRDMYIGLLCLMTNAVSMSALIKMAGGVN
ncbi:TPA: hypothetical protein ACVOYJ_004502 [Vibrio diabolicus]